MKISKRELAERRQRVADGTADDDDRRLVILYDGADSEDDSGEAENGQVSQATGTAEAEVVRPAKRGRTSTR